MDRGDNNEPKALPWVIQIENLLKEGLPSDAESQWTIKGVPNDLRKVHNNAFKPEVIAIGPFNELPQVGGKHQLWFLNRLLEGKLERHRRDKNMRRTTEGERASDDCERKEDDASGQIAKAVLLAGLEEAMSTLAEEIVECYWRNIDVILFVVNGCFVVELLRINYDLLHGRIDSSAIKDDPIFTGGRILKTLRRDLLLLENQLPFFVLEKLYEVIYKKNNIDHQQAVPLEVLAITFFEQLFPGRCAASDLDAGKPKAQHLLDLIRSTFLASVSEKVREKKDNPFEFANRSTVLQFASQLEEAGVQFEKRKGHDLLDIEFRHRTLRVPPLSLDDDRISLLLNMVAYEQSVHHPEPFFTNYLTFWDSLVNNPRDIEVLHKHGIICSMGNEEDVAKLLIRCREAIYDPNPGYLYGEIKGVNEYCERFYESKYRVWWRSLVRERFSSPWTCLSLFAAIILLLLTLLQTIYTVYPYYQPN